MTQALAKFEEEAQALGSFLSDLVVDDDASFQNVSSMLVDIKTTLKEIEAERVKISGPIYESFRATNALFTKMSGKYEAAESAIKGKLAAYYDAKVAAENLALAASAAEEVHSLALVDQSAPAAAGISMKPTKKWRILDAELVPDEFWVLDEKLIAKAVRASVNVPGIEVYTVTSVAAGSR